MRAALRRTAPAQYEEMVQGMVQGIGYAGTASHAEASRGRT